MLLYKSRVLIASVMHGIFYILPVLNLTLGYGNDGRLSIVRDTVTVQLKGPNPPMVLFFIFFIFFCTVLMLILGILFFQ